jgi:hypothetical protein
VFGRRGGAAVAEPGAGQYPWQGRRRGIEGRRVPSSDVVRTGAFLALLAAAAWTALGLVAPAVADRRDPGILGPISLSEVLYVVALVGTLGGLVALRARQAPGYGLLGTAGFLAAFGGITLLLVGLSLSFLSGDGPGPAFLDPALAVALWATLLGFALLGAATLKLGALPRRCGWALIVCVPLAIVLGDHGGGVVLGVAWLAQGHALLSQRDVSALLRTRQG